MGALVPPCAPQDQRSRAPATPPSAPAFPAATPGPRQGQRRHFTFEMVSSDPARTLTPGSPAGRQGMHVAQLRDPPRGAREKFTIPDQGKGLLPPAPLRAPSRAAAGARSLRRAEAAPGSRLSLPCSRVPAQQQPAPHKAPPGSENWLWMLRLSSRLEI